MTVLNLGYVISNRVMRDECPICYLYREQPDNPLDSGWRVFAGDESQAYADEAANFVIYNASTLLERDPTAAQVLGTAWPCAFERAATSQAFMRVE